MKNHLLLMAAVACSNLALAQTDTSFLYYNLEGKKTTKDSANTHIKYYQQGDVWHGIEYYSKKNKIKSEGDYADNKVSKPVGHFRNFNDEGELDFTAEYINGELVERTWYHKNGSKRSWVGYSASNKKQRGWDESGKEIANYIAEREARFKGGLEAWKSFLMKNLNASIAADMGAPVGSHTVKMQLIITKEGYVSNVEPLLVPKHCKPCVGEVERMLLLSPRWEPAIQHNVPVIYQALQNVTFQVAEETKKKNRFW